jgi:hypothetical protein
MTVLGDRDGKDTYPEAYTKGHGGIADPKIPDQFSGFLEAGLKVRVVPTTIPILNGPVLTGSHRLSHVPIYVLFMN